MLFRQGCDACAARADEVTWLRERVVHLEEVLRQMKRDGYALPPELEPDQGRIFSSPLPPAVQEAVDGMSVSDRALYNELYQFALDALENGNEAEDVADAIYRGGDHKVGT